MLGLRPPSPTGAAPPSSSSSSSSSSSAAAAAALKHHHHQQRRSASLLPPAYALPQTSWESRRMVESGVVPVPHFGPTKDGKGRSIGGGGIGGGGGGGGGGGSTRLPALGAAAPAAAAVARAPAASSSAALSNSSSNSSVAARAAASAPAGCSDGDNGGGDNGGGGGATARVRTAVVAEADAGGGPRGALPTPPAPHSVPGINNGHADAAAATAAGNNSANNNSDNNHNNTVVAAAAAAAASAASVAAAASGALPRADHAKFVQFFRNASPYISGHRGRTFVVVIPGEVVQQPPLLESIMADIALLHGLGVRLVLVIGAAPQIDAALRERGEAPLFVGGYRVTGAAALEAAVEAAGRARTAAEQYLSRGPSVPVFRRHAKADGGGEMHFGPALSVVSGNCVAAKRRGVLDGVDYGYTGEVRFVAAGAIRRHLDDASIVLLSNLGFTSVGEVLNCNTYDVGLHAAVELGADKLICLHLSDVADLGLPQWLPVSAARRMLLDRLLGQPPALASMDTATADNIRLEALQGAAAGPAAAAGGAGGGAAGGAGRSARGRRRAAGDKAASSASASGRRARRATGGSSPGSEPPSPAPGPADGGNGGGGRSGGRSGANHASSSSNSSSSNDFMLDLGVWQAQGFPTAASVAVVACCRGVKRAHLVDARADGGVLLELYSRDGIGTMISADFYEGIRRARPSDLEGLRQLLAPLEAAGVLVARTREELRALVPHFVVLERESRAMGCVLLLPLGEAPVDGRRVAEIGAFCVDPAYRGSGRGDSLLDYAEQEARAQGVQRLVLLTTRTADWFMARDFRLAGAAWSSELLPEARRARVDPSRNSQLYAKELVPLDDLDSDDPALPHINPEPGKRIGF